MSTRAPRETQTREKTERKKSWAPASRVPEPLKSDQYSYRWIRTSTLGQADNTNVSAKFREGWEPVGLEEQPKFKLMVDPGSRFKDNIEVGGLLLCKTPQEFVEQRDAHFAKQAQMQVEAVDNTMMRQSDPRMPMFKERKSSTSFGKGI